MMQQIDTLETNVSQPSPLAPIAAYLLAKREIIFNTWRTRIENDRLAMPTAATLARDEFNDQIPLILDVLDCRLLGRPEKWSPFEKAKEHGLHRWQKGYSLTELLQELAHLHQLLVYELELFVSTSTTIASIALTQAFGHINTLMLEVIRGSTVQFDELQRQEASQRAAKLQQALASLSELSQQRGELLRTATHDLRSYYGLIRNAAWLLDQPGTEEEQAQWRGMWQRNLDNAATLLTELMDLARLEAGQETMQLESFDAGELLRQIAQSVQPIVQQHQINLEWAGPDTLLVEGDKIKVQRIIHNLLINALHHTPTGLITLSWSREDNFRWVISIQDTGPGLPPDVVQELGQYLMPTADSTAVFQSPPTDGLFIASNRKEQSVSSPTQSKGEGIGLMIVKRLCELLHATMDIETKPDVGTIFRIIFPMHYPKSQ
ncbi:sensor histidine kinase [Spirosoma aerolatum]|uniref:sensor histidine kinase n=1 Tax=Spirosoma aerolatum TaxID=1211326 RepID=UPI001475839B|nr:HAMP domain-containing sensor histidine kinase [Spirosoma aerolatum]